MSKRLCSSLLLLVLLVPSLLVSGQASLPSVEPVANPVTLPTDYGDWDWEAFLTQRWYQPADPLSIELPDAYQGSLPTGPFDLSTLRFLDEANLNAEQQALLAQNGFVVVPAAMPQYETAYYFDPNWDFNDGHGYWITTDGVLHALYVAFTNLLTVLESEDLYNEVRAVALGSYQAALTQYDAAQATQLAQPARAAVLYYAVALGLLDPSSYAAEIDERFQAESDALIAAANAAEGLAAVPFLPDYQEDFSQYITRGNYTTTEPLQRYFKGMMWLGRITFLARDDESLQASLLALRALDQSGTLTNWATVSDTLSYLVGPTDNLGPTEYLPLAQATYGTDLSLEALADASLLAAFRAEVQAVPGPRINNVVRPIGTEAEQLDEATRGFRLFGQRFTFDGYAMQRLIYPHVGAVGNERMLPSGLDIAAVLGSDHAYALLEEANATAYANFNENLGALRAEVNQITGADWLENVYGAWLMALQPLWNRPEQPYPALMNTDAWRLRDLHTGLASWAELKHATVLYTAQPMGGLGGGGELVADTTNYVEPNPLVFSRVAVLAATIANGIEEREDNIITSSDGERMPSAFTLRDSFAQLAILSARLAEMSNKHLWGIPLSDDEQIFLKYHYGSDLWLVRYYAEMALADPPEMAAIVTDVASNPDAGTVLQVGTGYADLIYVVTDSPQGLQLTRGSVYSYYEFVNDIDNRLTDEAWHARLAADDLPPRPTWIGQFFSQ